MMTRVVSWLFLACLVMVALLLVLPGFIDWGRHKDLLINEISARLGQEIRINGAVSLSLLPNPHVRMEDVTIGPEGKDRYLATFSKLDARMSFEQLLHGRFEIDQILLKSPVINVINGKTGSNWSVFLEDLRRDAEAETSGKTTMIVLRQMKVEDARIVYRSVDGAPQWELPGINMSMGAAGLSGPYQMRGDFMYGDEPVTFTLQTAARTGDGGIPFEMKIEPVDDMPAVDIDGKLSPSGADAITAAVSIKNGGLRNLLRPFPDYYRALEGIPAIDDRATSATFDLAVSSTKAALRNITATLGKGATLAGDAVFHVGKFDIDADITLTAPGYWLSFDGRIDVAQRHSKGAIMLKAESLSAWGAGLPDISAEVSGIMSRTAQDSWSIGNLELALVEWSDVEFTGRAQKKGAETAFALEGGKIGSASGISLEGKADPDKFDAAGKATLYGQPVTFALSGQPNAPEISVDLQKQSPNMMLEKLGLSAQVLTLEGGASAFTGRANLQASELRDIVAGRLQLTPAHVVLDGFNPAKMAATALGLVTVPKTLGDTMQKSLREGKGRFASKPLDFVLPLESKSWKMDALTYDGGSFNLLRQNDGTLRVEVQASTDGMPAYAGNLPLSAKNLPVDETADIIRARNPVAKVDTQEAIGGILNRLDTLDLTPPALTGEDKKHDPVDIFKTAPPVLDIEMPPQPQPALPEVEVGAPPALPEDTPLAVDPVGMPADVPPDASLPEEIFPVETDGDVPSVQ